MLQIVRPDIVVALSEYAPPRALGAAVRAARVPRIEDDERRGQGDAADSRRHGAVSVYEAVREGAHGPSPALCAADIMTQHPVTLPLDATVEQARQIFRSDHFHHIPLTRADGRIGGIVSQPWLFRHAAALRAATLAELAVTDVLTATPDTPIREIAAAMLAHRVGCVPVVEVNSRPVGIITRSDILRVLVQRAPVEFWA